MLNKIMIMSNITDDTPVVMLTVGQLKELLGLDRQQAAPTQEPPRKEMRFVYGLYGISSLFKVSRVTAQKYKNTFLSDACLQHGRKIIVDVDKALQLFEDHYKTKS